MTVPREAPAQHAGTALARLAACSGALLGASGVAAGAFGAHALRDRLAPDLLSVYDTAARYQLWHALALLGAAWVAQQWPGRAARAAVGLLLAGTVIFSGSLYLLALTGEHRLGALTPLGGIALVCGWLALARAATRRNGA